MGRYHLSIIGLGLLGGSIGLAVRSRLNRFEIWGYDQSDEAMNDALVAGAIDTFTASLEAAVTGADWIILCVPPGQNTAIFRSLCRHAKPGAIVTDVTSTKRSIATLAAESSAPFRFVGSHPIAGSEKGGIANARPDLFHDALCVVTPTLRSDEAAVAAVEGFWRELGCRTVRMTADEHDRQFAAVSHLPHAVAAALVNATDAAVFALAGKGFADTTRIAAGNPELWRDILLDNADHVRDGLRSLGKDLQQLADLLAPDRGAELLACLQRAADARRSLESSASVRPSAGGA